MDSATFIKLDYLTKQSVENVYEYPQKQVAYLVFRSLVDNFHRESTMPISPCK
jgi:hypothetical protein